MFWDNYVMDAGVKLAERHLGSQGRFRSVKNNSHSNVALYTHLAGKFWYGDINIFEEKNALQRIARGMKETLYVISGEVHNIRDPKMVLLEVTV